MKTPEKSNAISNEFHDFLADMETLLKQAATLTGEELSRAKEKISARVATAKVSVAQLSSDLAVEAQKAATVVNQQVHAEPWKAIGVGAAVGVVLGFLLARR